MQTPPEGQGGGGGAREAPQVAMGDLTSLGRRCGLWERIFPCVWTRTLTSLRLGKGVALMLQRETHTQKLCEHLGPRQMWSRKVTVDSVITNKACSIII